MDFLHLKAPHVNVVYCKLLYNTTVQCAPGKLTHLNIKAESFAAVAAHWGFYCLCGLPFWWSSSICKDLRQKIFLSQALSWKKRKMLATWQFLNFLQHPEICIEYVACPGDDADQFLLPLHRPKHFFGKLLCEKIWHHNFLDEKTQKSTVTSKPQEQFWQNWVERCKIVWPKYK